MGRGTYVLLSLYLVKLNLDIVEAITKQESHFLFSKMAAENNDSLSMLDKCALRKSSKALFYNDFYNKSLYLVKSNLDILYYFCSFFYPSHFIWIMSVC